MVEMKFDEEKNNLKLPKNIRQVGKPGEKIKIYVEDYVITYINQIAGESADRQRLAVLLGRMGKIRDEKAAFISGAVEARNVVVQEDTAVFTSEIWTQIYDEIGQYFHDTEVVGWFLTRPGKALGINDRITKIHVDNFPGMDKTLFMVDPQDHEEAFFVYDQGELVRQKGYYIYYERNEDMQNYMVDHKTGERSEPQTDSAFLKKRGEFLERRQAVKKDAKASGDVKASEEVKASEGAKASEVAKVSEGTKSSADAAGEKRKLPFAELSKSMKRAGSVAATFAVLFALIFAFTQLNRQSVRETGNFAGDDEISVDVAKGDLETLADTQSLEDLETEAADTAASGDGETSVLQETESSADASADAGDESEVPVQNVIRQYEVRQGDTLAGISEQFYDSYNYIELIQEMNQIEDPDMIYPGMLLNLPDKIEEE